MMFRRASSLFAAWEGDALRVQNYARRASTTLRPAEVAVLSALESWRTLKELQRALRQDRRQLQGLVTRLRRRGLVESSDEPPTRTEHALHTWRDWSPLAAAFHFGTKDIPYADRRMTNQVTAERLALDAVPSMVKTVRGRPTVLPDFPRHGTFPSVLRARRSWRRFGPQKVGLKQLATVLGLTWGTQRWLHLGDSRLPLKTSPSGGACHSLEAYVAVLNVEGLRRGLYHYGHDTHTLTRLRGSWDRRETTACLAGQDWFAASAAVVFLTSVFPRVQWRYTFSRAYRTVLLEAGHFCQTFCLTATWLGLAPFCTAALADSRIEKRLGLDGVTESVLYAMGLGTRPRGVKWAPWPGRTDAPPTSLPAYRRRQRR
jgi:SagB-type dehydrogenase family enzyme